MAAPQCRWWLLLAASAGGYAATQAGIGRLTPSQFENSFSLLAWQFLFFSGMTVGFLRGRIIELLPRRARVVLLVSATALTLGFAVLAWNSPWAPSPAFPRLSLVSPDTYGRLYVTLFERRPLGLGRLVNLVVFLIAAYGLLSRHWLVVHRAVGGFLVPIGQASLYVFVVHLAFVLLVANLAPVLPGGLLVGTLVHTAVLLILWVMVRSHFLFGLIPR